MNTQLVKQLLKNRLVLVAAFTLVLVVGSIVAVRNYNNSEDANNAHKELADEAASEKQFATTKPSDADTYVNDFKYVSDVKVGKNGFSPSNVVVKPQTKVSVTGDGDSAHFIALAPGSTSPKHFSPKIDITQNSVFQMKFETAGTYSFYDKYNPLSMLVVTVTDK